MKYFLAFLVLHFCAEIWSQESYANFGDIPNDEVELKSYKQDKKADAVILFDIGKSKFIDVKGGYHIEFTRHKRIKIFKKSALEYAEISIPFYNDGSGKSESIVSIEAVTYNFKEDKKTKTKLEPSAIHEEIISNKWKNKKFIFPNVQEGSILEFKYTLVTPFHFNLPDWTFQDRIPTLYSEYEVRMIPFYEYVFWAQGILRFDHQTSIVSNVDRSWGEIAIANGRNVGSGVIFQDYVHTFGLKHVPAFKDESYISSINDYVIKLDFQLSKLHSPSGGTETVISTWPELNKSLKKHSNFGKYEKGCQRFAKKVLSDNLKTDQISVDVKAQSVVDFVKQNFNWNGVSSKYSSQSPSEFFKKKSGNSADINLFLVALLNAADIMAHPVVLSTRNHGKINSDYPFDHLTNYAIAYVQTSTPFLVDGTEELLSFNRIPLRCLNGKGLVVNDSKKEGWVDLKNKKSSYSKVTTVSQIEPKKALVSSTNSIQMTEYDAYVARSKYNDDTIKIKAAYAQHLDEIQTLKTTNYKALNLPYIITFQGISEMEQIGSKFLYNPFHSLGMTENLLIQKNRNYPVDFVYKRHKEFNISIVIPKDYIVLDPPAPFEMDNELASISLEYTPTNTGININGHYSFKKSIYQPQEYARIKRYMDVIVKKFNAHLIADKVE